MADELRSDTTNAIIESAGDLSWLRDRVKECATNARAAADRTEHIAAGLERLAADFGETATRFVDRWQFLTGRIPAAPTARTADAAPAATASRAARRRRRAKR